MTNAELKERVKLLERERELLESLVALRQTIQDMDRDDRRWVETIPYPVIVPYPCEPCRPSVPWYAPNATGTYATGGTS